MFGLERNKNIVCLFIFIIYFLVKYEDRGTRRERNRALPEVSRNRDKDRSRSRSPQNQHERHQHRRYQDRRQRSPGRQVRQRSGSGHSSGHSAYSEQQHREQQLAITTDKINRVQQAIDANQMDQDYLRQVQDSNHRLLMTTASAAGGVTAVQQFPAGMVPALQQYSAVGAPNMAVVPQYSGVVSPYAAVGTVQQYPTANISAVPQPPVAVQQQSAAVGVYDGASIQGTGDMQVYNNSGVYCYSLPAPPSVVVGVTDSSSVSSVTATRNEGDGVMSTSAGSSENNITSVKAKEDDPEVVMLQKVNVTDKALREVATLNKKIETETKNRKDAMVRSETALNKKIESECENTYKVLKRDLQETLANTVKTVLKKDLQEALTNIIRNVLPGIIVNMLTKPVNAVITKHGIEVNESFTAFKKRLVAALQEYEDVPDKCVNSLVNLENTWQKTFDEVSNISANYVNDINKTKVVVNELGDCSKKMATELLKANKRFNDSHDNIKEDLKNQMATLQTIMEKLQITDLGLDDKVKVSVQVAPVVKDELSPSRDPLSLSMIQSGIIAKVPAVLPDLATESDISLQETFEQCEEVMRQ